MVRAKKHLRKSRRFRDLEKELSNLKKHLLPRTFDPTGTYPVDVYTKTRAYRVLVHAELEAYIEDRARELALATVNAWKTNGNISRSIPCMLAFSGISMSIPPDTVAAPLGTKASDWDEILRLAGKIDKAVRRYFYNLKTNHGIKEENILQMLLPVGIEADDLDALWLNNLTSFGTERGIVAHTSTRTQSPPDPKDELQRVENIMIGFKELDELVNELMP